MIPDTRTTTPYAAFLLRVTLGLGFLAHGLLLKIGTFGLAGTMGFFGSIGYPPVLGAVVAIAETAAGIALLAGVWVRAVSLLTLPIMIGATLMHLPNGWIFSAQRRRLGIPGDVDRADAGPGGPRRRRLRARPGEAARPARRDRRGLKAGLPDPTGPGGDGRPGPSACARDRATLPWAGMNETSPPAPPGLVVTRMKDNQAALGVALHFLGRRKPFAGFRAGELVATIARQVDTRRYMMAFDSGRLVGFLGWDLFGAEAAERFAATMRPPRRGEEGGEDVVWLLIAAAEQRRALMLMLEAGRRLYPGRRVMGVRHKPGGRPVVFRAAIRPPR